MDHELQQSVHDGQADFGAELSSAIEARKRESGQRREATPKLLLSERVRDRERERLGGAPRIGLALSGGGIRSATFALGLVQALHRLRLFSLVDYVSTVSGGGYLGGWLYAMQRRGQLDEALTLDGEEPRQVRFLRAYSNYLTPKLGLFSGDTWAAVSTVVRNLTLTFSILSLSLLSVLFVPWAVALTFRWLQQTSESPAAATWLLVAAGLLLALAFAVSAGNMARPLRTGGWQIEKGNWTPAWQAQLFVVAPILVSMMMLAAVVGRVPPPPGFRYVLPAGWSPVWAHVANAGVAYGAVWAVALAVAYLWKATHRSSAGESSSDVTRGRDASRAAGDVEHPPEAASTARAAALKAWLVLTSAAAVAGAVGGAMVVSVHAAWFAGVPTWPGALLMVPVVVVGFLLATTVHIGLAGTQLSEETREWWARVGGQVTLAALMLTALSTIALWLPGALRELSGTLGVWLGGHPEAVKPLLIAAWGLITGSGVFAGNSEATSDGRGSFALELAGKVAPVTFIVGYLTILATFLHDYCVAPEFAGASAIPMTSVAITVTTLQALVGAGFFAFVAVVLSWRVDLNEFSLHAFYRNRLVRCYLGASNDTRTAHPFTGFDGGDEMPLSDRPVPNDADKTDPHDAGKKGPLAKIRPYPLFNTAINLVGGGNLAWQQRMAASFVFTPDFCGYEYRVDEQREQQGTGRRAPRSPTAPARPQVKTRTAYCETHEHAGYPLTVGLAMATSGAAASPNMGYHTSPTLAFLMTVFNVRLGWWLRNARFDRVWHDAEQRLSLRELVFELLGLTTDERDLVYLSDGGHFENLGIYELVRRQCPFIIASDAGQDGQMSFEDLGNAIEKCRADFGIDIEIDVSKIRLAEGRSRAHCAIGTIHYEQFDSSLTPGTLLYIKSALTGDEPTDVLRYGSLNPEFPHQSTADQFFSESQFESYRALGYHVGREVFRGAVGRDANVMAPAELVLRLRQRWSTPAPGPDDAVAKYSQALNAIWATVRTDERLRFLDGQMFPEWASLMTSGGRLPADFDADPTPRTHDVNYWLPDKEDQRRAGFYICTEMLQLMEDVFLEFRLDEHDDHIDNRGWMNLFQHWAWSGMLSATWAVTASTYDPRFQRFCRDRLDLLPGRVSVPADAAEVLPSGQAWQALSESQRLDRQRVWQRSPLSLNFLEVDLLAKLIGARSDESPLTVSPVRITVKSPRPRDPETFEFTAGYVVLREAQGPEPALVHMRVQNHLRKMGVAREALAALVSDLRKVTGGRLRVEMPDKDPVSQDSASSDEALPRAKAARRLAHMVDPMTSRMQASPAATPIPAASP
jgi:hypothetical protein